MRNLAIEGDLSKAGELSVRAEQGAKAAAA